MTDVAAAVQRFEQACRAAFDLGAAARERCRADGDSWMAAVVDLELDQLVKDRAHVLSGGWSGSGPAGLSVNTMIGRGWENEQDERCRAFADAIADASRLAREGLGLSWDWTAGPPPGWDEAAAALPEWPQPWNPPLPPRESDPTEPQVGQPWWDRLRRATRYRLTGRP